jgi:uncharacterized phage protein (TIGR01671 family)
MVEIKFRIWVKSLGYYLPKGTMDQVLLCELDSFDWIVEQFTGLSDKNGKEIYEGDIVKSISIDEYADTRKITDKIEAITTLNDYIDRMIWIPRHGEVIGNIHENPWLLK